MTDPGPSYYHLRYHLWVGVHRDSSGSNDIVGAQDALE
jgi:hypothetical protein